MASFEYDAIKNAPMHKRLAEQHRGAVARLNAQGLHASAAAHEKAAKQHDVAAQRMSTGDRDRRESARLAQQFSEDARVVLARERAAASSSAPVANAPPHEQLAGKLERPVAGAVQQGKFVGLIPAHSSTGASTGYRDPTYEETQAGHVIVTAERTDHQLARQEALEQAEKHDRAGNFREAQTMRDMARFHEQKSAAVEAALKNIGEFKRPHDQLANKLEQTAVHDVVKTMNDREQERIKAGGGTKWTGKEKGIYKFVSGGPADRVPKPPTPQVPALKGMTPLGLPPTAGHAAAQAQLAKGAGGHWETGPKGGTVWVTANGTRIYGRKR